MPISDDSSSNKDRSSSSNIYINQEFEQPDYYYNLQNSLLDDQEENAYSNYINIDFYSPPAPALAATVNNIGLNQQSQQQQPIDSANKSNMRINVINELVQTEKSYLKSLSLIIDVNHTQFLLLLLL